jgi:hypothetical protein
MKYNYFRSFDVADDITSFRKSLDLLQKLQPFFLAQVLLIVLRVDSR